MVKRLASKKVVTKTKKIVLSKAMQEAVSNFLQGHPPERLSHNLTSLLLEFMANEGAIDSSYLQDLAFDLQGLFEFLDFAEREKRNESGLRN